MRALTIRVTPFPALVIDRGCVSSSETEPRLGYDTMRDGTTQHGGKEPARNCGALADI